MYKYFEQLQTAIPKKDISKTDISKYKNQVIEHLRKAGASDAEIKLVNAEMIESAINNNHTPAETAWAIQQ